MGRSAQSGLSLDAGLRMLKSYLALDVDMLPVCGAAGGADYVPVHGVVGQISAAHLAKGGWDCVGDGVRCAPEGCLSDLRGYVVG